MVNTATNQQDAEEKTQNTRTFPIPLSEKNGFDFFGESPEVMTKGCSEPREGTLIFIEII